MNTFDLEIFGDVLRQFEEDLDALERLRNKAELEKVSVSYEASSAQQIQNRWRGVLPSISVMSIIGNDTPFKFVITLDTLIKLMRDKGDELMSGWMDAIKLVYYVGAGKVTTAINTGLTSATVAISNAAEYLSNMKGFLVQNFAGSAINAQLGDRDVTEWRRNMLVQYPVLSKNVTMGNIGNATVWRRPVNADMNGVVATLPVIGTPGMHWWGEGVVRCEYDNGVDTTHTLMLAAAAGRTIRVTINVLNPSAVTVATYCGIDIAAVIAAGTRLVLELHTVNAITLRVQPTGADMSIIVQVELGEYDTLPLGTLLKNYVGLNNAVALKQFRQTFDGTFSMLEKYTASTNCPQFLAFLNSAGITYQAEMALNPGLNEAVHASNLFSAEWWMGAHPAASIPFLQVWWERFLTYAEDIRDMALYDLNYWNRLK